MTKTPSDMRTQLFASWLSVAHLGVQTHSQSVAAI